MINFLIINYLNGATDIKVFDSVYSADRYYNNLLKTKYEDIASYKIIHSDSLLICQNGDVVRGY